MICEARHIQHLHLGPPLNEALGKIHALRGSAAQWHFIGRLQANKTRVIAEEFSWVHGIDRLRLAERLSQQRPHHAPPLNVCLQVNIAGEASKGGVASAEMRELAAQVSALPRLRLRGLMSFLDPVKVTPEGEVRPAREESQPAAEVTR